MDGNSVGEKRAEASRIRDEQVLKAISDAFKPLRALMSSQRATASADSDRYMLTDRPGVPVFDGVLNRMMPSSRAKVWAREELMGSDYDGVHDDVVAEHLKAIANTLETGDLPDWVESDSRRGCCGATFRTECDDEGTTYFCRLCGKEQEP